MLYEGRPIELEPEAEEVAGFFAALLETDYAQNATFTANFFTDFRALLHKIKSPAAAIITQFEKCDFRPMFHYFEQVKLARKAMTREDRAKVKDEKARLDAEFAFCTLDGRRERVGNYRIEPPGLFRGRGQHPKTGKLKTRVAPEDITINCSPGAKIPLPPPGHQWKDVIHNSTVTWLATWTENINGVPKYVQLSATSSLKGKSDYKKFETARRLKHHIAAIRARNAEELRSKEMAVRQRATALWLIDHLAIRAGNEKGDDEADTVGCCSLRLEHVSLDPAKSQVTFDFLGKDSIRYLNTLQVDPLIIKNLAIFMRPPKGPSDMIFDRLDTSLLNSYLTSLMPGLTAKVFRTFNASITMQKELFNSAQDAPDASIADKLLAYNRANRQVAILCNHQRAVAKSHDQSMSKLNEKIMHLKYHRLLLKRKLHEDSGDEEAQESDIDPDMEKQIIREITELEMEKYRKKMERDGTPVDPKYQPPTPCPAGNKTLSKDALEKKIDAISIRIQAARHQATDREENKTTALGTSKINYIDPRITAAWCKTHQVPIEKMFTKTLRDKFKWAMDVPEEWRF
jgi:DNA topoisomerase I